MEISQQNQFLLNEPVGRLLPKFAVPCGISLLISCLYNIVDHLYNIVDQIFVGNGIGYLDNAATDIIFPITVIGWGGRPCCLETGRRLTSA